MDIRTEGRSMAAPSQSPVTWEQVGRADVPTDTQSYQPYGAIEKLFYCRDPEVLIDGPAGTGKSLGILHKLYACAIKWPRMRAAILRKYRRTLTDSALVTWEEEVLGPGHAALRGPNREQRHTYYLPNGSTVTVTGLDEAEKQKSSQYDFVYIQEATEITAQELSQVIRGMRNGKMVDAQTGRPWHQIVLDCNPDAPRHWLKQRFESGILTRIPSIHEDNPALWDHEREEWTPAGEAYLSRLDSLEGVMKLRLRYGLWAAAEGAVYDCFDVDRDVVEPRDIPDHWERRLGVDFGAVNTACLFYAIDPETGLWWLYREYHAGGRTAKSHVAYIRAGEPEELRVIGGAGNEGQWRNEFGAEGLTILEPPKLSVAQGITRVYGQHRRGTIKVFRTCTGYLDQKTDYRYKRDMIGSTEMIENKEAYHFMDAERYVVSWSFPGGDPAKLAEMLKQLPVYYVA